MRAGTYDAETNEGDIRSRFDIDAEPLMLSNVSIAEYHKLQRAVRSIETAAYNRAYNDMMRHMRGFKAP